MDHDVARFVSDTGTHFQEGRPARASANARSPASVLKYVKWSQATTRTSGCCAQAWYMVGATGLSGHLNKRRARFDWGRRRTLVGFGK